MSAGQIVISDDVFHGSSETGYQDAMSMALGGAQVGAGPECTVNIILFGMSFVGNKFCVSVQVIVTAPKDSGDSEAPKLNYKPDEDQDPALVAHALDDDFTLDNDPKPLFPAPEPPELTLPDATTHTLDDFVISNENILKAFNNEAIYDRLEAKLDSTWEVNHTSPLWAQMKHVIDDELTFTTKKPQLIPEAPSPYYSRLNIYTEEMDNLDDVVPKLNGFDDGLLQHLCYKAIEEEVQRRVEHQLELAFEKIPGMSISFAPTTSAIIK